MYLTLFFLFLILSFILVALGLFRPEHTELSLIGFVFLFILSLVIISGDIQIQTGTSEIYIYGSNLTDYHFDDYGVPADFHHDIDYAKDALLFHKNITNEYSDIDNFEIGGSTFLHIIGYWLAIVSVVGFIGVLLGMRKGEY